jgi:Fe-S-cluster containining protein
MGETDFGLCKGCGGRCCHNIRMLTNAGDFEMFERVGNSLRWVDELPTVLPGSSGGVVYIKNVPEIDSEYPSSKLYTAILPGACAALESNGACHDHKKRPDVCRYFKADRDCNKKE